LKGLQKAFGVQFKSHIPQDTDCSPGAGLQRRGWSSPRNPARMQRLRPSSLDRGSRAASGFERAGSRAESPLFCLGCSGWAVSSSFRGVLSQEQQTEPSRDGVIWLRMLCCQIYKAAIARHSFSHAEAFSPLKSLARNVLCWGAGSTDQSHARSTDFSVIFHLVNCCLL